MVKCGFRLEVSKEAKVNIAHTGPYSTARATLPWWPYFKGIANIFHARSQTEEAQLLNKNGDIKIYIDGVKWIKGLNSASMNVVTCLTCLL